MAPTLPVEITDEIIDSLQDDCPALLALCLVSSAWRARCQLHLFSSIDLTNLDVAQRLLPVINATPHLAAHIRRLQLGTQLDSDICTAFLVHCPLPRVIDLYLEGNWTTDMIDSTISTRLSEAFPGVQRLSIHDFSLRNCTVLMNLILGFAHVTHLYLSELYVREDVTGDVQLHASLPSLTTLDLEVVYVSELRIWTDSTALAGCIRHLRCLKFTIIDPATGALVAAAALAAQTADTLEQLEIASHINLYIEEFAVAYQRALGTRLGALRSLRFESRQRVSPTPDKLVQAVQFACDITPNGQTSIAVVVFSTKTRWIAERVHSVWTCTHWIQGDVGPASMYEGPAALAMLGMAEGIQ